MTDKERRLLRIVERLSERVKQIAFDIPAPNSHTPELVMLAQGAESEARLIMADKQYVEGLSRSSPGSP